MSSSLLLLSSPLPHSASAQQFSNKTEWSYIDVKWWQAEARRVVVWKKVKLTAPVAPPRSQQRRRRQGLPPYFGRLPLPVPSLRRAVNHGRVVQRAAGAGTGCERKRAGHGSSFLGAITHGTSSPWRAGRAAAFCGAAPGRAAALSCLAPAPRQSCPPPPAWPGQASNASARDG